MGFTPHKKELYETVSSFWAIFSNLHPFPFGKISGRYDFWKEQKENVCIYNSFGDTFFLLISGRCKCKK